MVTFEDWLTPKLEKDIAKRCGVTSQRVSKMKVVLMFHELINYFKNESFSGIYEVIIGEDQRAAGEFEIKNKEFRIKHQDSGNADLKGLEKQLYFSVMNIINKRKVTELTEVERIVGKDAANHVDKVFAVQEFHLRGESNFLSALSEVDSIMIFEDVNRVGFSWKEGYEDFGKLYLHIDENGEVLLWNDDGIMEKIGYFKPHSIKGRVIVFRGKHHPEEYFEILLSSFATYFVKKNYKEYLAAKKHLDKAVKILSNVCEPNKEPLSQVLHARDELNKILGTAAP